MPEGAVGEMRGGGVKGADHATARRRACVRPHSEGTASPHIPSKAAGPPKSR